MVAAEECGTVGLWAVAVLTRGSYCAPSNCLLFYVMSARPLPVREVYPVVTPASESFLLHLPQQWVHKEERQAVGSPQDLKL